MSRLTAGVTVLVLLAGFLLAPYSHVHLGAAQADHHGHGWHGRVMKHAHLSAHAHVAQAAPDAIEEAHRSDEAPSLIVSAHDFIFPAPVSESYASPVVLVEQLTELPPPAVHRAGGWSQPPAHGPPAGEPAASRAPPTAPPAA